MFSKCSIVVVALLALTQAAPNAAPAESARGIDETSYFGDFKFMYKVYQECAATELSSCLKLKLIAAMDRAARSFNQIPIVDGVAFVKESNIVEDSTPVTEADLEAQLPRALAEKDSALNNLIFQKLGQFFESHTLQVKFPSASELQRSFNGEERGKKKKMSGLLMIPLILGGTLVPLALGALALLAGKALIVSKLALVLAAIIGLKKLLGGGGSDHGAGHEVVVSGGHGSGWGRAYTKEEAQNLAYNAYAPKTAA